MEPWTDSTGLTVYVHEHGQCRAGPCPIHNVSQHHMRDWPQIWRYDRKIMERICSHGVGHPDPDCQYAKQDPIHGCDGCCQQKGTR